MNEERFDGYETGPEDADAAVIWLHGLGADCYDFAPIVPELGLPDELKIRFVFPNAPRRPVTLNGGSRMRAWYDIRQLDFDKRSSDETGARESLGIVAGLIARENARGVRTERIVVAGFSQGGAISILTGLLHPGRLAGAVALSTYLLLGDRIDAERSAANRGLPFFMAHGMSDPVVPLPAGTDARDRLVAWGHPVEWRTYPMPHAVHPHEIEDVGRFLAARFGASRA
ncbi:MAG TPA: carboxylesterase [Acidobacteriota bacterium]|nr:carboxylesterase [Acidobacteriota bacterium]